MKLDIFIRENAYTGPSFPSYYQNISGKFSCPRSAGQEGVCVATGVWLMLGVAPETGDGVQAMCVPQSL